MTPTSAPADSRALLDALKYVLRTRGITYAQLAEALSLSLPTIKRQLSRGGLSVERLLAICAFAEIDLHELARASRHAAQDSPYLDLDQEQALAASETMMLVFHLLLAGWEIEAICREYQFHRSTLQATLAQLQALKLVSLPKQGPPRLRVTPKLAWRHHGPVMRRYGAAAMQEFLRADFAGADAWLAMETRELSAASRLLLRRKLEQFQREFLQLAELDAALPASEEKRNAGMIVALRPWTFSIARTRQREGRDADPSAVT